MRKLVTATLAALAVVTTFGPAFAGTYEDNVFPRGFPRWGSSPRHYEDRNIQPRRNFMPEQRGMEQRGGMQQGRGMNRSAGRQSSNSRHVNIQSYTWHRRTVTTTCSRERWVIRGGVKETLGYGPCD